MSAFDKLSELKNAKNGMFPVGSAFKVLDLAEDGDLYYQHSEGYDHNRLLPPPSWERFSWKNAPQVISNSIRRARDIIRMLMDADLEGAAEQAGDLWVELKDAAERWRKHQDGLHVEAQVKPSSPTPPLGLPTITLAEIRRRCRLISPTMTNEYISDAELDAQIDEQFRNIPREVIRRVHDTLGIDPFFGVDRSGLEAWIPDQAPRPVEHRLWRLDRDDDD